MTAPNGGGIRGGLRARQRSRNAFAGHSHADFRCRGCGHGGDTARVDDGIITVTIDAVDNLFKGKPGADVIEIHIQGDIERFSAGGIGPGNPHGLRFGSGPGTENPVVGNGGPLAGNGYFDRSGRGGGHGRQFAAVVDRITAATKVQGPGIGLGTGAGIAAGGPLGGYAHRPGAAGGCRHGAHCTSVDQLVVSGYRGRPRWRTLPPDERTRNRNKKASLQIMYRNESGESNVFHFRSIG